MNIIQHSTWYRVGKFRRYVHLSSLYMIKIHYQILSMMLELKMQQLQNEDFGSF